MPTKPQNQRLSRGESKVWIENPQQRWAFPFSPDWPQALLMSSAVRITSWRWPPFSLHPPLDGCRSALAWGAGHSAGVIVLVLIATGIKGLAHGEAVSSWAEILVGVALLVVGALALRTSFGLELDSHSNSDSSTSKHMRKMIN